MWPARKCISRLPRTPKPLSLVFLKSTPLSTVTLLLTLSGGVPHHLPWSCLAHNRAYVRLHVTLTPSYHRGATTTRHNRRNLGIHRILPRSTRAAERPPEVPQKREVG